MIICDSNLLEILTDVIAVAVLAWVSHLASSVQNSSMMELRLRLEI